MEKSKSGFFSTRTGPKLLLCHVFVRLFHRAYLHGSKICDMGSAVDSYRVVLWWDVRYSLFLVSVGDF